MKKLLLPVLFASFLANAQTTAQMVDPTPTGFQINTTAADLNTTSTGYMYIAFR